MCPRFADFEIDTPDDTEVDDLVEVEMESAGGTGDRLMPVYSVKKREAEPSALDTTLQYAAAVPKTTSSTYPFGAFFKCNDVLEVCSSYRGVGRGPEEIFQSGFHARGTDLNLSRHVLVPTNPSTWWHNDSAYVSTTSSREAAVQFSTMKNRTAGFVYELNFQEHAPDVRGVILQARTEGKLTPVEATYWLGERERAVPYGIAPQDIRGAWSVQKVSATDGFGETEYILGRFIKNPGYIPSTFATIVDATKILGRGAAVIGTVIDGVNLYDLYQQSKASEDYNPFFKGTATVAAKWTAAVYAGTQIGGSAALAAAPLGPYASLAAGVFGGG